MPETIRRINYRNSKKDLDFEIVDLKLFFSTRAKKMLERDFRLNFWAILYITEGEGFHSVDFKRYPYKKGDMIIIQKNQVHKFEVNKEARGFIIHINEPFFYRMNGFSSELFLDFIDQSYGSSVLTLDTAEDTANHKLINLIYAEYNKREAFFDPDLIATLFQGFLLALRRQISSNQPVLQSKDYEHFKEFRQLIEENYTRVKTVDEYASMMHLSKKTVNQAVRNVADMSAKTFITNRIILEIKRYLSQGQMMNYEIADALGFDEAANMSRFFKRYAGVSPKAFRETLNR